MDLQVLFEDDVDKGTLSFMYMMDGLIDGSN